MKKHSIFAKALSVFTVAAILSSLCLFSVYSLFLPLPKKYLLEVQIIFRITKIFIMQTPNFATLLRREWKICRMKSTLKSINYQLTM